jgi:hypothetical protein
MRRHFMDPFALVFGVTFAAVGSVFLFGAVDLTDLHLQWTWPLPLIVLGLLIVGLSFRRARDGGSRPTLAGPTLVGPTMAGRTVADATVAEPTAARPTIAEPPEEP